MAEGGMILVTGLWKGKTKSDQPMLSGDLNSNTRIIILPNPNHKNGDNKPHTLMYLAKKERKNSGGSSQNTGPDDFI
jgi:hypothetical protein